MTDAQKKLHAVLMEIQPFVPMSKFHKLLSAIEESTREQCGIERQNGFDAGSRRLEEYLMDKLDKIASGE